MNREMRISWVACRRAVWVMTLLGFGIGPLQAQRTPSLVGPECGAPISEVLAGVAKTMSVEPGTVATYVVETRLADNSQPVVRDTVVIVRTPSVVMTRSTQGLSVSSSKMGVQVIKAARRILVYTPTKALQSLAIEAQREALAIFIDLVRSSARTTCRHDTASDHIVATTALNSNKNATPRYQATVRTGGENGPLARQLPSQIVTTITPNASFVSLTSVYPRGSVVESVTVMDLSVRHARAEEMQAADAMIDSIVSKRGEPKGAYKGYAVVDLRSATQQSKQH